MLKQHGPFIYGDSEFEAKLGEREQRDQQTLKSESVYLGEWLVGKNIREGRGIQVWPDGSLYEGYWQNNQANGTGRLLHKDGDVYQGEWKDDKAHGFGYYFHQDGSFYRGFWANDT